MKGQDELIMRKSDGADVDVGLGEDYRDVVADVGCYADLYIVNQENTDLFREVHTGNASFALHGPGSILLSVA